MFAPVSLPAGGAILLGALVTIAAVYDIAYRRIPNWLVLSGMIAGFGLNGFSNGGSGWFDAASGFGLGFILYFPLYLIKARGAGDVKLLAAAGSLSGARDCVWIFLLSALIGGISALVLLAWAGQMRRGLFNAAWIVRDLSRFRAPWRSSAELDVTASQGLRLPHGAIIAAGVFTLLAISQ